MDRISNVRKDEGLQLILEGQRGDSDVAYSLESDIKCYAYTIARRICEGEIVRCVNITSNESSIMRDMKKMSTVQIHDYLKKFLAETKVEDCIPHFRILPAESDCFTLLD